MMKSRQDAERFLEHPEPTVRIAAIEVLAEHWKPDSNMAPLCEGLAFSDADFRVRSVAITTLASLLRGSDDTNVGEKLASVVRDERQPVTFRLTAYHGLFSLRGRLFTWEGRYLSSASDLPFPDGVDWSFVESFLDRSRSALPVDPLAMALPNLSNEELTAVRLYRQGLKGAGRGQIRFVHRASYRGNSSPALCGRSIPCSCVLILG